MEDEELEEIARKLYIQAVEQKVREYQSRDFRMWHYWKNRLQEVDPDNPLLEVGFHGLPYFGV